MKNTIKITLLAFVLTLTANIAFAQDPPTAKESPTPSNGCVSGNCVNGKGKKTYDNGSNYEGDFVDGKEDGQGTLTYVEGSYYVGKFKNGEQTGKGKMVFYDGDTYEGDFVKDKFEGQGTLTLNDGSYYIGGFKNDNKNGYGKEYDKSKKLVREGTWKNDVFVGSAKPNATVNETATPNATVSETATLLRETLNGKFDFMESKRLVYVLTMKKSNETFRYQIEFINDSSDKLAFRWQDRNNSKQSEKLVITDKALASASKYVNIFTTKSALSPDTEITFILSQTLYKYLKADQEIRLDLGNGVQKLSFKDKFTPPSGVYTNKNVKKLHFQTADEKTKIQILDDPVCPLIVGIETPEYTLTLVKGM